MEKLNQIYLHKANLFLLLAIFIYFNSIGQTNWKKIKDDATESIEKITNNKSNISTTNQARDYIVDELNQRYNIDDTYYKISKQLSNLNCFLSKNYTLGGVDPNHYYQSFRNINQKPVPVRIMDLNYVKEFNWPVRIQDNYYSLFIANNKIYLLDGVNVQNKSPVGKELYYAILMTYYSETLKTINPEYFNNLIELTKAVQEVNKVILGFLNAAVLILNEIENLEYMNVSAENIIDQCLEPHAYGLKFKDIHQTAKILQQEFYYSNEKTYEFYKTIESISNVIDKIKNSNEIDMVDIRMSTRGFNKLSEELNAYAEDIHKKTDLIENNHTHITTLSDFYNISFIESFGSMCKVIKDYMLKIEKNIREYGRQFDQLTTNVNINAESLYNISFRELTIIMNKQYNDEHQVINELKKLNHETKQARWNKMVREKFILEKPIDNLIRMDAWVIEAIDNDIYKFINLHDQTSIMINNLPLINLEGFYHNVLQTISRKQIIGGLNIENAMIPFENILRQLERDKYDVKLYSLLIDENKNLDKYYKSVKRKNSRFYFIMLFIITIVSVIVFIIVKKR